MTTPTTPYEELKKQLSEEKQKPKDLRDKNLMKSLFSQINEHKKALQVAFKKRMKEVHKEEVDNRLRLEKKRIAKNRKIRKIVLGSMKPKKK